MYIYTYIYIQIQTHIFFLEMILQEDIDVHLSVQIFHDFLQCLQVGNGTTTLQEAGLMIVAKAIEWTLGCLGCLRSEVSRR